MSEKKCENCSMRHCDDCVAEPEEAGNLWEVNYETLSEQNEILKRQNLGLRNCINCNSRYTCSDDRDVDVKCDKWQAIKGAKDE